MKIPFTGRATSARHSTRALLIGMITVGWIAASSAQSVVIEPAATSPAAAALAAQQATIAVTLEDADAVAASGGQLAVVPAKMRLALASTDAAPVGVEWKSVTKSVTEFPWTITRADEPVAVLFRSRKHAFAVVQTRVSGSKTDVTVKPTEGKVAEVKLDVVLAGKSLDGATIRLAPKEPVDLSDWLKRDASLVIVPQESVANGVAKFRVDAESVKSVKILLRLAGETVDRVVAEVATEKLINDAPTYRLSSRGTAGKIGAPAPINPAIKLTPSNP